MDWAELSVLTWRPGGEALLTVEAAVRLTSPYVDFVTLDVKTYTNAVRRAGGRAGGWVGGWAGGLESN